jgi:aryl-alcohol dehydrogenase-like predicted oxidoreductase
LEYRRLGKSGLKISEIGLGANNFGGLIGERESITLIRHALDSGINHIDTADAYSMGGERGGSEKIIGKAIKDLRSEVILATKFGLPMGKGPNKQGASRNYIIEAVEASLRRLNTDYIDLYSLHVPDMTTPIEETLRTLNDLVRSGKVRYIGCCNFNGWQLCDALWTSKSGNLEAFSAAQSNYNMFERGIEAELAPCCQTYDVGFVAFRPLLEGFLTGKYRRGEQPSDGTRLATPVFKKMANGVLTEENFDKLEKLEAFAMQRGRKVGELAIAWLLSHPWVSSVLAAATKPEQISGNVGAAEWKLTAAESAEVEQICRTAPATEFRMPGIEAHPKRSS